MSEEPKQRHEIVDVTPALAASWLGTMRKNRSLSQARVRRLAEEMKAGRWVLNGQAVVFDREGRLIDGQHRLQAILHADRTVRLEVRRGVAPAAWDTIDTGRSRSKGDFLTAKGRAHGSQLAAVLRLMWQYELGVLGSETTQNEPTPHDLVGLDDEFPAANEATLWSQSKRHTRVSGLAFLRALLLTKGPADEARDFFDGIMSGARLEAGTGTYAAREMLLQESGSERRAPPRVVLARIVKAWNATLAERSGLKRLSWSPEEEAFPTIHLTAEKAKADSRAKKGL